MSWYVMSFCTEQDEAPDAPAPELVVVPCFECGNAFTSPAGDGERFCGMACEDRWCRRALAATGPTTDDGDDSVIPF